MNRRRVQKLRDFIAALPARKLWLNSFVSRRDKDGCGTVCCVAGWACTLFDAKRERRDPYGYSYTTRATEVLGVTLDEHRHVCSGAHGGLFGAYHGGGCTYPDAEHATPRHHKKQALARLDALLALPQTKARP